MSVHSVRNPGIPVSIPDELESFLHVLLYLALRYLYSSLQSPGIFIDHYFMSSWTDEKGKTLCGTSKQDIMVYGRLVFDTKPITFLSHVQPSSESHHDGPPIANSLPLSPLNQLIEDLLLHFKALYAVREYNAALKAREIQSVHKPLPSLYAKINSSPAVDADPDSDGEDRMLNVRQRYTGPETLATLQVVKVRTAAPPKIQEPSDEEKMRAASLMTHHYVKGLFYSYIKAKTEATWPDEDYVGDQLKGYVCAEQTSKRPRLQITMAPIVEAEESDAQPSSGM